MSSGVIVPSSSPWRHKIVVVPKNDGGYRLTVNYKPLYSCTVFNAYPFPHVDDLLKKLGGAKVMSTFDFSQFYHQIPLVSENQEKSAFFYGKVHHFTRCPFGLRNAVALCCSVMAKVFEPFDNVVVYLDDIVVFGQTEEEHNELLTRVLERIRDLGLCLNKKKCHFNQSKISFLGYEIENGVIRPDESRCEPVCSFPLPTCVRSLQRFVGMMTYYSRYIPSFSEKVKCLYDKMNDFGDWTDKN